MPPPPVTASRDEVGAPSVVVAKVATLLVVIASTVFVFVQVRPGLLFSPNMDVGGDNAAHVVAANYLIHDLLPHLQISGWDPQWFGGFPLYVFYFPLPAVLIAALSVAFPFAVAFKLVTVLGSVLLPTAAYAFGRLAGFERPVPALMSASTLAFLFNSSYTIDGGNLPSTLAGEFSFSLSLACGLFFLGVVAYSLRSGRLRWLAAVLFVVTLLCHVVPALCFAGAAAVLWGFQRDRARAARVLVPIGVVGVLLASFWLLRFGFDLRYASSMGYSRVVDFWANMFPLTGMLAVPVLAIIGGLVAVVRGNRTAMALGVTMVGSSLSFAFLPSGLVYNGRWLPFYFLMASLLAAYAVAELGRAFFTSFDFGWLNASFTAAVAGIGALAVVAAYVGVLPGYRSGAASSFIPSWVAWNYSGYQAKPEWDNFAQLTAMLTREGKLRGCGRLDYEYSPNFNTAYGSTLVPMSFPMWTDGCIQSVEGLYYESSTTTPFHFLDQALVSTVPSNPVVGIPYQTLDVARGIDDLEETGVKYFLANSAVVERAADTDPRLTRVAAMSAPADAVETSAGVPTTRPEWVLYEISDSQIVAPLHFEPVVEAGMSKTTWLATAIGWYQNPRYWSVPIATSGPASWRRVASGNLVPASESTPLGSTTVSAISTTDSSVSFNVTTTGIPVLVKVPYFPNWRATGAEGPYPSTPNLMIVVPTSHHVVLRYGTTTIDWIGRAGSLVGLGSLLLIRWEVGTDPSPIESSPAWMAAIRRRREEARRRRASRAATRSSAAPDPGGPDDDAEGPRLGSGAGPPDGGRGLFPPTSLADRRVGSSGRRGVGDEVGDADVGSPVDGDRTGEGRAGDGPDSDSPALSVVLPAHNEIGLLGSTVTNVISGLERRGLSFEILIVENGSTDGTLRLARLLSAQIPRVRVLTLPIGNYGAALYEGFVSAHGRLVICFDVDYYDFAFLDAALSEIDRSGVPIVLASKRAPGAKDRRPIGRRLLTAAFAAVLRVLVQLEASDAHGMKVLDRAALAPVVERCVLRGSLYDVELVIRAMDAGLEVAEIPAVVVERRPPRTSLSARSIESLVSAVRLRSILRAEARSEGPAAQSSSE